MTNCLFYALALYWRRRVKGKRIYLALRKSDFTLLPHFVVFELRHGHYRVVSYKPLDPRIKQCPPPVFVGAPRWGDGSTPPPASPVPPAPPHPPKENSMSESNYKPDGTGVVMGDTKPMPDRGTKTGMTGYNTHGEGMGLGMDDTNSTGAITGATGSDPMDQCCTSDDPAVGGAARDKASY